MRLTPHVCAQGDADSERFMYGGRVVVHTPPGLPRAQLHLDNVELARMGQAFRLGRYAVHFHFHGDAGLASWLRSCSIRNTYSSAVALHATSRVMVQNNVAYNTMGHAYFMEVGMPAACSFLTRLGGGGSGGAVMGTRLQLLQLHLSWV